nr:MAG TPA: hypothetical protein [Caudoviricetes sp.]
MILFFVVLYVFIITLLFCFVKYFLISFVTVCLLL